MDPWDKRQYELFTSGEAEFTDVAQYLDRVCRDYGSSNGWAKANGLGPRTVQEIIRGLHLPSDKTLQIIGLQKIIKDDKRIRYGFAQTVNELIPGRLFKIHHN